MNLKIKLDMNKHEWAISSDTGISSKTMYAAISGMVYKNPDIPSDPSDFGRCYRFVRNCNITNSDLIQVSKVHKWFSPFIENWDKLCDLYEEERSKNTCPKLYEYIQELRKQSDKIRYPKSK